ncbi:MAG: hypothetical protein Q8904_06580 [Bacteroidota bacterium]|nr:hypothetical protein [Bacteroidota bacterium]
MKRFKRLSLLAFVVSLVSVFSGCDVYSYVPPVNQTTYVNPQWAPPYSAGVRYYYLPDIETYYDLTSRDFVYLYNGQWISSDECPFLNTGFDLNNCFTVALDVNVFQPWRHHHYYVSHYPRYYYQDYYDHSNIPYVRGFNENSRSAIYWKENERSRARRWDSEALKTDHKFKYTTPDRQQQNNSYRNGNADRRLNDNANRQQQTNWNNTPGGTRNAGIDNSSRQQQPNRNNNPGATRNGGTDNTSRQQQNTGNPDINTTRPSGGDVTNRPQQNAGTPNVAPTRNQGSTVENRQPAVTPPTRVRATQSTNYYGRSIGQPVRVEKQMRQQRDNSSRDNRR